MSRDKIIYWGSTGLVCGLMVMSAGMYFVNPDNQVSDTFSRLGYPTYIMIPLAIAKLLAVVAILTKKSALLKEWAYAGLFFDFVLASLAHIMVNDGEFAPALVAMILLIVSRIYDEKLYG